MTPAEIRAYNAGARANLELARHLCRVSARCGRSRKPDRLRTSCPRQARREGPDTAPADHCGARLLMTSVGRRTCTGIRSHRGEHRLQRRKLFVGEVLEVQMCDRAAACAGDFLTWPAVSAVECT